MDDKTRFRFQTASKLLDIIYDHLNVISDILNTPHDDGLLVDAWVNVQKAQGHVEKASDYLQHLIRVQESI